MLNYDIPLWIYDEVKGPPKETIEHTVVERQIQIRVDQEQLLKLDE